MKPPFWEVSIFTSEPGQPITIESISCFSDSAAMRRYVLEQRVQSPTVMIRAIYRTSNARWQSSAILYDETKLISGSEIALHKSTSTDELSR